MALCVEEIEKAVLELYSPALSEQRLREVQAYLVGAQQSSDAWIFCWTLLEPTKSIQVQFFGASTLYMRISRHFGELPKEQYGALRDHVMKRVTEAVHGSKLVLSKCLCVLAAYVTQTMGEFWTTAVEDLIAFMEQQQLSDTTKLNWSATLLEFLLILPDEFERSINLRFGQEKAALRVQFSAPIARVFAFLSNLLSNVNPHESPQHRQIVELAIRCVAAWCQHGMQIFEMEDLVYKLFTLASVACTTVAETLGVIAQHQDSNRHPTFVMNLIRGSAMLQPIIQRARQINDEDGVMAMYGFMVDLGESHSQLILNRIAEDDPEISSSVNGFLSMILECSGAPGYFQVDEMYSKLPLTFWYTLAEESYSHRDSVKIIRRMAPLFEKLVDIQLRKLRLPAEYYTEWNVEDCESYDRYRQDIIDSLSTVYSVLRGGMLAALLVQLNLDVQTFARDPNDWRPLESILYAFQGISGTLMEQMDCNNYLVEFFDRLKSISPAEPHIVSHMMTCIGSYSEWLNNFPEVLRDVLPLLLIGMNTPAIRAPVCQAFASITRDCHPDVLAPMRAQIIISCQNVLRSNEIRFNIRLSLLRTIGRLAATMTDEEIIKLGDDLLGTILQELSSRGGEFNKNVNHLIEGCECIGAFLHALVGNDRGYVFATQRIVPLLGILVTAPGPYDEKYVQAIVELVRSVLSGIMNVSDSAPTLGHMIGLIVHLFNATVQASVLTASIQAFILASQEPTVLQDALNALNSFATLILQLAEQNFHESTDLLAALFALLSQLLKKKPEFVIDCGVPLFELMNCAIVALGLPERQTFRNAVSFITQIIVNAKSSQQCLSAVEKSGPLLVHTIVKCIAEVSPRTYCEHFADIIISLNKLCLVQMRAWFEQCIREGNVSLAVLEAEKRLQFIKLISRERGQKQAIKKCIEEFAVACRGLEGSEYAAQTALRI